MPKEIEGSARRRPPEPSASHSEIDDWLRRQMPHPQPIVRALDESVRAAISGLHYAVKMEAAALRAARARLDHRAGRLRRFGQCRLLRGRRLRLPAATRNHRPHRYVKLTTLEETERPELQHWIEQASRTPAWT
jgi:hypothetical protein